MNSWQKSLVRNSNPATVIALKTPNGEGSEMIVIEPQVARCGAPLCSTKWRKMSEGKLFVFHIKQPDSDLRQMKKVWLCEDCFESWGVTLDPHGQVVLWPLGRMAA